MNNSRYILTDKNNIGRFFVYMVAFVPLFYKLVSPFFIVAGLGALTIYITGFVLWLGIFLSKKDYLASIKISDVFFYLFVLILILFYSIIYPPSFAFVEKNIVNFALFVAPYFFIGLVINFRRDSDIIYSVAYLALFVLIFWQACRLFRLVEVNETVEGYLGEQMEQGYMLLFPSCYLFAESLRFHRIIDILATVVASTMLFFMGAKGPSVVLLVFFASYALLFHKFSNKNIIKKIIILLIAILIFVFFNQIITALMPAANMFGFNTRVFESFINGELNIENSSGRDDIYATIIQGLKDPQGNIGYGWGGDRLLAKGYWAHNLELEILAQFGLFLGGLLLLFIIFLLVRCYYKIRHTTELSSWYVLFFMGIMELQLSYTYINHPLFFVLLGYCFSIVRRKTKMEQVKTTAVVIG